MARVARAAACLIAGLALTAVPAPRPATAEQSTPSCTSNVDASWLVPGEYEGQIKAEWKRPNKEQGAWQDGSSVITGVIRFMVRDDGSATVSLTLDSQTLLGDVGNWSIDETLHAVFVDAEIPAPTDLGVGAVTLRGSATGLFRAKDNPVPNKWIDAWEAYGAAQDPNIKNPSTSLLLDAAGGCDGARGSLTGEFIDRVLVAGYYWTFPYPYAGIPLIEWTAAPTNDPLASAWAPYQRRLDALPDPPKGEKDRAAILKEVGAILAELSTSDEKWRTCLTKRLLDWYMSRVPAISKQIVDEMIVELGKLEKTPQDPYGTRFYVLAEEWVQLDYVASMFGSGCGLVRAELPRILRPAEAAELAIANAGECPVAAHIDRYVRMLVSVSASDQLVEICQQQDPNAGRPRQLGDWTPGPISALIANAALAYAQTGWVMSGDTTSVDAVTEAIVDAGWILVE